MANLSVLVVEDHPDLLDDMLFGLSMEGFDCASASSMQQAMSMLDRITPDLLILDRMLPDGSGMDIARCLHGTPGMGVVMLTALSDLESKLEGLECVDAYLVKPVDIRELAAVLRSLYRRMHPDAEAYCWRLDPLARLLYAPRGPGIDLTDNELVLLDVLSRSPGREAGTRQLVSALGQDWLQYEKNRMELIISRLRKKINKAVPSAGPVIKSIRNGGYALTLNVSCG